MNTFTIYLNLFQKFKPFNTTYITGVKLYDLYTRALFTSRQRLFSVFANLM